MTFAEITDHQNRLLTDPNFDPAFDQLIDMSEVTSLAMSAREAEIVSSRRIFSQTSRRALVAVLPDVFGLGRLMKTHHDISSGHELSGVFRNREAAEEWLRS